MDVAKLDFIRDLQFLTPGNYSVKLPNVGEGVEKVEQLVAKADLPIISDTTPILRLGFIETEDYICKRYLERLAKECKDVYLSDEPFLEMTFMQLNSRGEIVSTYYCTIYALCSAVYKHDPCQHTRVLLEATFNVELKVPV